MRREDINWTGVREFFKQKILELKNIRDNANADNEEELLLSSLLDEVIRADTAYCTESAVQRGK